MEKNFKEFINKNQMTSQVLPQGSKARENIAMLIKTIQTNKKFSRLILYSLTTLKCYIMNQNNLAAIDYSLTILNENLLPTLKIIFPLHVNNDEVVTRIGEILFCLMYNNQSDPKKQILGIFNKNGGFEMLSNFLISIPSNNKESFRILLKVFQLVIDNNDSGVKPGDMIPIMNILAELMTKFKEDDLLMIYVLDSVKKIFNVTQGPIADSESDETNFIDELFKTIEQTDSSKIACVGIHLLDIIVKNNNKHRTLVRNKQPISFILSIIAKFRDDHVLSFHCCGLLSKILEKEDIVMFLKILKLNADSEYKEDSEMLVGMLDEFKELILKKDEEVIGTLKKNITRVLILMSKDINFIQILKEINSVDALVELLKTQVDIYFDKNKPDESKDVKVVRNEEDQENKIIESVLPDFLRLIFSLLKNFEIPDEMIEETTSSRKITCDSVDTLISDLAYSLGKCLIIFESNKTISLEIIEFLNSKDKRLLDEYIDQNSNNNETCKNLFLGIYKSNYDNKVYNTFLNKLGKVVQDKSSEDLLKLIIAMQNSIKTMHSSSHVFGSNQELPNPEDEGKSVYSTLTVINFNKADIDSLMQKTYEAAFKIQVNVNFNENSFQEFVNLSLLYSETLGHLVDSSIDDKEVNELLMAYSNFTFCAMENPKFGLNEEKVKVFLDMLKKIVYQLHFDFNVCNYLISRLTRMFSMSYENKDITKEIISKEIFISFISSTFKEFLGLINDKKPLNEESLRTVLKMVQYIQRDANPLSISQFIRENGIFLIIQLCYSGSHDFDTSKLIIQLIQGFSTSLFKISCQNFKK